MRMLSQGTSGEDVKRLQAYLKITIDGTFGPNTKNAVMRYQLANGMTVDGIAGNEVWTMLQLRGMTNEHIDLDTDVQDQYFKTNFGQVIHKHYLPKGQFLKGLFKNDYAFLHHTAGSDNPYSVIDSWGRDDRGEIATEFVIGGQNCSTGKLNNDGIMLQAFPDGAQAWHLGATGSGYMNRHSVGLEICSMGYLDDELKTYVGSSAITSQVCELKEPFKGRTKWHNYSDAQIEGVKNWLKFIAERDNIDIRVGLVQWIKKWGPTKAFDFNIDAHLGNVKGLLTHTNVRKDKTDCYPHPGLIDMLMSL